MISMHLSNRRLHGTWCCEVICGGIRHTCAARCVSYESQQKSLRINLATLPLDEKHKVFLRNEHIVGNITHDSKSLSLPIHAETKDMSAPAQMLPLTARQSREAKVHFVWQKGLTVFIHHGHLAAPRQVRGHSSCSCAGECWTPFETSRRNGFLPRALASWDKTMRASSDHLPPTSSKEACREPSSAPVSVKLAQVPVLPLRRGSSSLRRSHRQVVSMASCAPPKNGSPPATTSNFRPLATLGKAMSRSRQPHSLKPTRVPSTPDCAHAARWWPQESSGWPHRQERAVKGRGNGRRSKSTWNSWGSTRVTRHVGYVVNDNPAPNHQNIPNELFCAWRRFVSTLSLRAWFECLQQFPRPLSMPWPRAQLLPNWKGLGCVMNQMRCHCWVGARSPLGSQQPKLTGLCVRSF